MQSVTSAISTTMVLVLLGLVILFVLTAQELGDSVRENLTVTVVLQDDAPTAEAAKLQKHLSEMRYVSSIEYISAERALKEQIESMGIDPTDFLGANPFSISMELKMKAEYSSGDSLEWIAQELRETPLVSEVTYQKDLVDSLNKNLKRISLVLLGIAALLVVVSLSLINNMVRLSVFSHRFIIHTMKLVGAKWSFIRRPFMLRSLAIGLISATAASATLYAGIQWANSYDEAVLRYITLHNMLLTAAGIYACGLIITLVCTYISVTHFLRSREDQLY